MISGVLDEVVLPTDVFSSYYFLYGPHVKLSIFQNFFYPVSYRHKQKRSAKTKDQGLKGEEGYGL